MAETRQTGLHACTHAATAAESKFRIEYPNSRARVSRIIALDDGAAGVMASLTEEPWNGAEFLRVSKDQSGAGAWDLSLDRIDGSSSLLSDEINGADVVVMISTTTEGVEAAEIIGGMARLKSIMTAGLVLADESGSRVSDDVIQTFRPYSSVLVVATDSDYVPAMLTALRA